MINKNQTAVTEFLLLGIPNLGIYKYFLFLLLFMLYMMTIFGNLLIICLVTVYENLHKPMYFFLTQLSISDILMATNINPNTFFIVLKEEFPMTLTSCLTQLFLFCVTLCVECFLLTAMACDRYLAISNPLRYNSLMSHGACMKLVVLSWMMSCSISVIDMISISGLRFCGPNVIDHFFCDLVPLLQLACSDTSVVQIEVLVFSVPVVFFPLIVIAVSYVYIVLAVLKLSSKSDRQKAFSTCSSHLTVVCMFYGTISGVYMLPNRGMSLTVNKVTSLLYTIITPMCNPIIYSLRNSDIKEAIRNSIKNIQTRGVAGC